MSFIIIVALLTFVAGFGLGHLAGMGKQPKIVDEGGRLVVPPDAGTAYRTSAQTVRVQTDERLYELHCPEDLARALVGRERRYDDVLCQVEAMREDLRVMMELVRSRS